MENCPSCKAPLKSGLLSSNSLLPANALAVINTALGTVGNIYCYKCKGGDLLNATTKVKEQVANLSDQLRDLSLNIPILTIHNPAGWNYTAFGIVTAQSVTGTGVFSELSQSFDDFFGGQSSTLNAKIKQGEQLCFAQLRRAAVSMGANAIIGTDIDYSELGGGRGMVMVCSSGTAVHLNNLEVMGDAVADIIKSIPPIQEKLDALTTILKALHN